MTVLSKLIHSLVPKTLTGIFLLVLPIAAAVIVVVYPHAITQLLIRDDPEKLLDELTGGEAGKRKKKIPKAKGKRELVKGGEGQVKESEDTDSAVEASNEDEEERLLQLVKMQAMKVQAVKKAPKAVATTEVQSPSTVAIEVASEDKEDGETWTRVPTKEEELVATLRGRIANLMKQLEASTAESLGLKTQLEKKEKHAMDAERELKERSRTFQIRWVEMESEITSLKGSKVDLLNKINEFKSATQSSNLEETIKAQDEKIKTLESKLAEVEILKNVINVNSVQEAKIKSELEQVRAQFAMERDVLANERKQAAELRVSYMSLGEQNNSSFVQLEKSKKMEAEMKENIRYLENELVSVQTLASEYKKELEALEGKMKQSEDEKESAVTKVESEMANQISAFKAHAAEAKGKESLLENELDQVRTELDQVKVELDQVKVERDQVKVERDQVKVERDQVKVELDQVKVEFDQVKVELEESKRQAFESNKQAFESNRQASEFEPTISGLRSELEESKRQASELEPLVSELRSKLEIATADLDESKRQASEFEPIVSGLRSEVEELKRQASELKLTAPESDSTITGLQSELGQLRSEIEESKKKVADFEVTKDLVVELEAKHSSLQADRLQLVAELEKAQSRISENAQLLERAEKKYDLLSKVAESKYEAFKKEISELQSSR